MEGQLHKTARCPCPAKSVPVSQHFPCQKRNLPLPGYPAKGNQAFPPKEIVFRFNQSKEKRKELFAVGREILSVSSLRKDFRKKTCGKHSLFKFFGCLFFTLPFRYDSVPLENASISLDIASLSPCITHLLKQTLHYLFRHTHHHRSFRIHHLTEP